MKRTSSVSRRLLACLLVLGVVVTLAPRPVFAADASLPPSHGPIATSVANAARTLAAAAPAAKASSSTDEQKSGEALAGSSSFFTTPAGIAILGILAAGTGYAIYSTSHDRIHSQTR